MKQYDKAFKAKVSLEALRGKKTIQRIAAIYQVGATIISLWKKEFLEGACALFERGCKDKTAQELEKKQEELYKQVGKFHVVNEFLKKYR